MKKKTCAAFLFEGFLDHQVSLALACLNSGGNGLNSGEAGLNSGRAGLDRGGADFNGERTEWSLETFSARGANVTSATGFKVTPHASLEYMQPQDFDILLLPGGAHWEKGDNLEIFPLITAVAGCSPLIAIGEAVLGLADLGLLDDIPHTGCRPGYIRRYCPEYMGAAFFRKQPCVSARKIITIDGEALLPPGHGMLGLFDTLQKIYANTHELFDQEQQRT